MAYKKYANTLCSVNNITSSRSITIEEVTGGKSLMVDTTSGEVELTLPAKSSIPDTSDLYSFSIIHSKGSNNVKVKCNGAETFEYGNTFFNLGKHLFSFTLGGLNTGSVASWGLMRNVTIKASSHRDANWAAANFSSMTIIPWDTEEYNNNSELLVYTSGASARYTILTDGSYKLSYNIDIDSTGGSTWNATAQVYKNGVALENTEIRTGNYGNEDQSMALIPTYIDLVAGDYIDLRIDQNSLTGNLIRSTFNVEIRL